MIKLIIRALIVTFSVSIQAANLPDFPFVLSVGSAEREVVPNEAKVLIRLLAFEQDSNEATKKVHTASEAILEALDHYKISTKHLEANDLKKRTTRNRDRNYNNLEILGYEVTRGMTLNLKDLSSYGQLINNLSAINGVSEIHASFDVSNRDDIEKELITEASQDAQSKAEIMALGLGTKVHSVYAISQASDFGDFFATFGAHSVNAQGFARDAVWSPMKTFIPEKIKVKQSINVVFRLKKN